MARGPGKDRNSGTEFITPVGRTNSENNLLPHRFAVGLSPAQSNPGGKIEINRKYLRVST